MNDTVYVSGHQNPDTDSIISAIAYAHLLNKLGKYLVSSLFFQASSFLVIFKTSLYFCNCIFLPPKLSFSFIFLPFLLKIPILSYFLCRAPGF